MSETKHSPEPWRFVPDPSEEDYGDVMNDGPLVIANTDNDDGRRIVACVNACAGIPTEALEAGALRGLIDAVRGWSDIQDIPVTEGRLIKARVDALEYAWRRFIGRLM